MARHSFKLQDRLRGPRTTVARAKITPSLLPEPDNMFPYCSRLIGQGENTCLSTNKTPPNGAKAWSSGWQACFTRNFPLPIAACPASRRHTCAGISACRLKTCRHIGGKFGDDADTYVHVRRLIDDRLRVNLFKSFLEVALYYNVLYQLSTIGQPQVPGEQFYEY